VVGLAAEARIAAKFGFVPLAGGGTPDGAKKAASRLVADGATALISFGLAGGLDPVLRPGMVVIPDTVLSDGEVFRADPALAARFGGLTGHCLLGGTSIAADAQSKRALLAAMGARAIDLESGSVARVAALHGLPFAVVRAICDPAERDLPPAALVALDQAGAIGLLAVLRSVLRQPGQIPALLALARDARQARKALLSLLARTVDPPCPRDAAEGPASTLNVTPVRMPKRPGDSRAADPGA
jgi:adenosylhomocysteine nucleosidase